jgi:hypothetical protein
LEKQILLTNEKEYLYGMVYEPDHSRVAERTLLVCPPIGPEWANSVLPLVQLSRNIASCTHTRVIRLDYSCTGDSSGDFETFRYRDMLSSISHACEYACMEYGLRELALLGIRLGGLAALSFLPNPAISEIYLYDPVLDRTKYCRELMAVSEIHGMQSKKEDQDALAHEDLNLGGYSLSALFPDSLEGPDPDNIVRSGGKIKGCFFTRRGSMGLKKPIQLLREADIRIEEYQDMDPFWNHHSMAICSLFGSRLIQLLL